jgi:hypothetical protein
MRYIICDTIYFEYWRWKLNVISIAQQLQNLKTLVGTCDLHTQCEGGEIGEEVRSVGKVTKETKGIPSSSVILFYFFVSLM